MTQEQKNFFEILYSFGLYLLILPIGYLLRVVYTNSLSIEEVGLIYSTLSILAIAGVLADFGINQTVTYFGTKAKTNHGKLKKIFWQATTVQLWASTIITLLLAIFAKLLTTSLDHPLSTEIFYVFIIFFLLNNWTNAPKNVLSIFRKQQINYFADFVRQALLIGITIYAVIYLTLTIRLVAWLWVGTQVVYLLILLFSMYKHKELFSNIHLERLSKKKLTFTYHIVVANISKVIYQAMDIIMITYLLGLQESAIYSTSLTVNSIFDILVSPITAFIIPIFASMQTSELKKWTSDLYRYMLVISLPVVIALIISAKEYLGFIFGSEFVAGETVVQIIAIFAIFKLFIPINFNFLIVKGLVEKRTKIILWAIAFNLVGNFIAIHFLGMVGVAIVTGISWMMVSLLSFKEIRQTINVSFSWKWISTFIIANIGFLLAVFLLRSLAFSSILIEILVVYGTSYLAYLGLSLIIGSIEMSKVTYIYKLLLSSLKQRIRPSK